MVTTADGAGRSVRAPAGCAYERAADGHPPSTMRHHRRLSTSLQVGLHALARLVPSGRANAGVERPLVLRRRVLLGHEVPAGTRCSAGDGEGQQHDQPRCAQAAFQQAGRIAGGRRRRTGGRSHDAGVCRPVRGTGSLEPSTGTSDSASTLEKITAADRVTASSANMRPTLSCRKAMGAKTATSTAVVAITAKPTWRLPRYAASNGGSPRRPGVARSPAPRWSRPPPVRSRAPAQAG
jgi:hypothetical protein